MKRFLAAAVLAATLGLGTSSQAHAQIVYGYTVPTYGGIGSTGTLAGPYGSTSFTNFYSPFTGTTVGQSVGYAGGINGGYYSRMYGYNPLFGTGFNYGYAVPNAYLSPVTNPFAAYYNPFTGITYYRRR